MSRLPKQTSRADLIAAMQRFDANLRSTAAWEGWEVKKSHKYAILWDGRLYPVKQVLALATGEEVRSFSGGEEANRFVTKRGLSVVTIVAIAQTKKT